MSLFGQPYPVPSVNGLQTAGGADYNWQPELNVTNDRTIFPVSPLARISCAVPRPGWEVNFRAGLGATLRAGGIDK